MSSLATATPPPTNLKRIVAASLIGTTMSGTTTHPIRATTCCFPVVAPPRSAPNQHRTSTGKSCAGWVAKSSSPAQTTGYREALRTVTHSTCAAALRPSSCRSRGNGAATSATDHPSAGLV
ncbi:hypothetical protein DY245_06435 [Streptomyces inhibens]|uniref:Uncharacterized protein n=1 Tax=Streptomyces inhibens TaxID=2293571 RepID=A0A371Q8U5_STRIH|nr:hypothetical protein DY245_06435 [Streptomyces inhibens]